VTISSFPHGTGTRMESYACRGPLDLHATIATQSCPTFDIKNLTATPRHTRQCACWRGIDTT